MPDYIDLTGEDRLTRREAKLLLGARDPESVSSLPASERERARGKLRRALDAPVVPEGDRAELVEALRTIAASESLGAETATVAAAQDFHRGRVHALTRAADALDSQSPADCGHPNHGNPAHDCRPFLPPAEGEEKKCKWLVGLSRCFGSEKRNNIMWPLEGTKRVPCPGCPDCQPDPPPADPQKGCENHGAPDCEACYVEALADPQGEEWPEEIRIVKDGDGAVEVLHPCDTDPAARRYIPAPTEQEGNERIANEVIAYHADQATTFELRAKAAEAHCKAVEVEAKEMEEATVERYEAKAQRYEEALRRLIELREWCREVAKHRVDEEPDRADAYRIVAGASHWGPAIDALTTPPDQGGDGEATGSELALRLADAHDVVETALAGADEDRMADLEAAGLPSGFFSALDHALCGSAGCFGGEGFASKRADALARHRDYLGLPASFTPESVEEGERGPWSIIDETTIHAATPEIEEVAGKIARLALEAGANGDEMAALVWRECVTLDAREAGEPC